MGNPRGLGTPVRLVPPAPVLVSASGGQQGKVIAKKISKMSLEVQSLVKYVQWGKHCTIKT